jgi:hypothetical protein
MSTNAGAMDLPESGNIALRNGVCAVKVRREPTWVKLTWAKLTWVELTWSQLTWPQLTSAELAWAVGRKSRSAGLRAKEWT